MVKLLGVMLLAVVMVGSYAPALAGQSSPVSSGTSTGGQCAGVKEYLAALGDVNRQSNERWVNLYPEREFMSALADLGGTFFVSRSSAELWEIANFLQWRVDLFREIDPPAFAVEYHLAVIDHEQVIATLVRTASLIGSMAAIEFYQDVAHSLRQMIDVRALAAVDECPDFAAILDR